MSDQVSLSGQTLQIGEVVVTARKREERLQNVPTPMTAFNLMRSS